MLTLATRLCPKDEEIAADVLDGEAIIINLASGAYYAMSNAGALVWRSIEGHGSIDEIAKYLADTYDVSLERTRADVFSIAERLMAVGVVRISEATGPTGAAEPVEKRQPYAPPEVNAYNDMRDLLAMDPPMPSVDALSASRKGGPPRS